VDEAARGLDWQGVATVFGNIAQRPPPKTPTFKWNGTYFFNFGRAEKGGGGRGINDSMVSDPDISMETTERLGDGGTWAKVSL